MPASNWDPECVPRLVLAPPLELELIPASSSSCSLITLPTLSRGRLSKSRDASQATISCEQQSSKIYGSTCEKDYDAVQALLKFVKFQRKHRVAEN